MLNVNSTDVTRDRPSLVDVTLDSFLCYANRPVTHRGVWSLSEETEEERLNRETANLREYLCGLTELLVTTGQVSTQQVAGLLTSITDYTKVQDIIVTAS